jgi:hypothetical protein
MRGTPKKKRLLGTPNKNKSLRFFYLLTRSFGAPNSNPCQSMWDLWWTSGIGTSFFPEYLGFHISIIFCRCSIATFYWSTTDGASSWQLTWPWNKTKISGGSGAVNCNVLHTDYQLTGGNTRQLYITAKFISTRMFCSCYSMWIRNSDVHACTRTALLKLVGKRTRSQSSTVRLHWYLFCYSMHFIKWKNIMWDVLILVCEWRRFNEVLFSISSIGVNVFL